MNNNYTKPALRERLKKQIMAGSKGGKKNTWSAIKSNLWSHKPNIFDKIAKLFYLINCLLAKLITIN